MFNNLNKDHYLINVLIALFVTFLWSSSFVIIKWGLEDVPPIIFSGFRYFTASILLVFLILLKKGERQHLKQLKSLDVLQILFYGLIFVFFTQGLQYLGLYYLPAISFTLILNLTIIIVMIFSAILLKEYISKLELFIIFITLIGIYLYFDDKLNLNLEILGFFIGVAALLTNSASTIYGRYLNRDRKYSSLLITGLSMSFGSILLLLVGLFFEKPSFSAISIIYILWLAIFNTALAFTLWNYTMARLRAIDSALINNTMLPQIVVLSFIFLNEHPNLGDWFGIAIVAISIFIIQLLQAKNNKKIEIDVYTKENLTS